MSLGTRRDLIFGHEGNARAAASVVLAGVLAALIGSVFMAIGPRFKQEPRATRDVYSEASSAPVRVVGPAPRRNGSPCEQQVWPNIDQRCLVRTEATTNSEKASSSVQSDTNTAKIMDHQSALPDAPNGSAPSNVTALPPSPPDGFNIAEPSHEMADLSNDNDNEWRQQEAIEPPRKRARRNHRSFHFYFGAFRF